MTPTLTRSTNGLLSREEVVGGGGVHGRLQSPRFSACFVETTLSELYGGPQAYPGDIVGELGHILSQNCDLDILSLVP